MRVAMGILDRAKEVVGDARDAVAPSRKKLRALRSRSTAKLKDTPQCLICPLATPMVVGKQTR